MRTECMDFSVRSILPEPRPQKNCPRERGPSADTVHNGGTREIVESHPGEEPPAPDPVTGHRVEEGNQEEGEEHECGKPDAFRNRSRNNRRRSTREDELEEELRGHRDGCPFERRKRRGAIDERGNETLKTDECISIPEHEGEPDEEEGNGGNGEDGVILRKDVHAIFDSAEARFDESESRIHEEDEERGRKDPDGVEVYFQGFE